METLLKQLEHVFPNERITRKPGDTSSLFHYLLLIHESIHNQSIPNLDTYAWHYTTLDAYENTLQTAIERNDALLTSVNDVEKKQFLNEKNKTYFDWISHIKRKKREKDEWRQGKSLFKRTISSMRGVSNEEEKQTWRDILKEIEFLQTVAYYIPNIANLLGVKSNHPVRVFDAYVVRDVARNAYKLVRDCYDGAESSALSRSVSPSNSDKCRKRLYSISLGISPPSRDMNNKQSR